MNGRKVAVGILGCLLALAATAADGWARNRVTTGLGGVGTGSVTTVENKNAEGFVSVIYGGSGQATVLGKFDFTAQHAVRWDTPLPNGAGGYCAPSSGSATLEMRNRDTLVMNFTGLFCEADQTGYGTETLAHLPAPPFTFTGTYLIVGGSGRFGSAAGSGSMTGSTDGSLNLTVIINGIISR